MNLKLLLFLPVLLFFTAGCNLKHRLEGHKKAQIDANYIINNFNKNEVIAHLPESNFPKEQSEKLIENIKNCDWENRNGHFVDYTTISNNGENYVAFIYEYFLKCDSLRFILIYYLDREEPKLVKINIEPLAKQNPMVIHRERQLLKYN